MPKNLHQLRITYPEDDAKDLVIPLSAFEGGNFLSLSSDLPIELPNGETIAVYAEVAPNRAIPDISVSVVEDGRVFGVRCGYGVVVTYSTKSGYEVLLQIGTGAWEE